MQFQPVRDLCETFLPILGTREHNVSCGVGMTDIISTCGMDFALKACRLLINAKREITVVCYGIVEWKLKAIQDMMYGKFDERFILGKVCW